MRNPPLYRAARPASGRERAKGSLWHRSLEVRASGAVGLRWQAANPLAAGPSSRSPGMACHVLPKHTIHSRLPALAGRFEVGNDIGTVTHGHEQLLSLRLRPTTKRTHRNHGL